MSINSSISNKIHRHVNPAKISKSFLIALQLGTFASVSAYAQEVTISDDRTSAVDTATIDSGSPADIVIDSDGSITVSTGAAVTVNSDNNLTSEGGIIAESFDNAIAIHVDTQGAGTLTSDINITSRIESSAEDNDNNVGSNNYGVLIDGDGTLEGDVTFSGNGDIIVFGDNSAGFSLQSDMVGDITFDNVGITGENSRGVEILGNLTGDILTTQNIVNRDAGTIGVYIGGDVDGGYDNTGALSTGRDAAFNFSTQEDIPAVSGIAAVQISGNLSGGFENKITYFNGDGDPVNIAEGDSISGFSSDTSSVQAFGGGYGVYITPEKIDAAPMTNITIGNTGSFYGDYSVLNQGNINVSGANSGAATTAVYITGAVDGPDTYTTTLTHGIYNGLWGEIKSESIDATAIAVEIGDHASAPEFRNNGEINVKAAVTYNDDDEIVGTGGDAYALLVNENASLTTFNNDGLITIEAEGNNTSAYGIIDRSGTISSFTNTRLIDLTLNSENTGDRIAVDLSENTTSIDFFNSGRINGDVLLGSGTNSITMEGLSETEYAELEQAFIDDGAIESIYRPLLERHIDGGITLEGGTATLDMFDNARLTGGIFSPNGQLNVTLNDQSELVVPATIPLNVENISINDTAQLTIGVSGQDDLAGGVNATGDVIFAPDSKLKIEIDSLIGIENTYEIISADNLVINSEDNLLNESDQVFIYDIETTTTSNSLSVSLRRKTAEELGLSENIGRLYEASVPALESTSDIGGEISSITTADDFNRTYRQMMPNNLTQASRQILINSNNLAFGAVSSHLDNLRNLKYVADDPLQSGQGLWAQQYGSMYNLDTTMDEKGADGFTFGIAVGYEFALTKRGAFGISLARHFADIKFDDAGASRMGMENTQLGVYGGIWLRDFFIEGQANVGLLDFESDRYVEFTNFDRTSTANWDGLHYSSHLKAGYQLNMGKFTATPSGSISYNNIKQDGYTETGGGAGVDLVVNEYRTNSMLGNLKMEFAYNTDLSTDEDTIGQLSIGVYGGWTKELNETINPLTARFAGYNNSSFTLQSTPLDPNGFQAGMGLSFKTEITNFSITYDANWKENYMAHTATMSFRVRF
ncbi:autotransporter outer membrane beta-barrel domain-containing protein [Pseudemcibacter aquimaris]|uniref:autotransporter outer membrane beta-barrel domain-containing protein n=1 Tax=Pseudemcibacter aquimaris TaxID=2857064 RepID=UPI0020120D19|nr:autotransporter outer membrane beta-barrel domain-containing protein [Pseudemcibacter aquimaris]MCC3860756.1 autotransporter domain-containing protein [Pseudemcibacter aquimaris]WDU59574.1 autotransporter domain-containing protein [Pseudemcibacter aquimaris]